MSHARHARSSPRDGESANSGVHISVRADNALLLQRILEALDAAVLLLDRSGRVTFLSQQSDPLFAQLREALLGKVLWEVFPEVSEAPWWRPYCRALDASLLLQREEYVPSLHRWFAVQLLPSPDGCALSVQQITARKHAEASLSMLASEVSSSDDAIFSKTLGGTILSWNAGAERLYGYSASEMIGQSVATLVPGERHQELADILQRLQRGERIEHFETTRTRKDGATVDVSVTISPVRDAAGQLIAASTIARDISARLRLERQLRASERRFRALVEHSADGIALVDRQGRLRYVSPSTQHVTGFPEEAVLGTNGFERVHPEERPALLAQFAALLERPGQPTGAAARYQHQDGSWRWLEGTATNLLADPDVGAVVFNFRDITARRQAEADQLFHASISRSLSEAVIATDPAYRIRSWNEAAQALYGWKPEEVLGQPVHFLHTVFADGASHPWEDALAAQEPWQGEVTQQRKDGTSVVVLASVSLVRDHAGTVLGVVAISRDITERTELEQRKDEFISLAGHELKTPLTSVLGYVDLLQMQVARGGYPELQPLVARLATQVEKLPRLIADFLDLSRMRAGHLTLVEASVEVDGLVVEEVETLQRSIPGHQIRIQGRTGRAVVGDRERLGQALSNLLGNAIKYSPGTDLVLVHLASTPEAVTVSVQDFGIGIAQDQQEKIFARYYRASSSHDRPYPGLGIGLYFAQQIIERHGGNLWVDSVEGQGSTFSFSLPCTDPAP